MNPVVSSFLPAQIRVLPPTYPPIHCRVGRVRSVRLVTVRYVAQHAVTNDSTVRATVLAADVERLHFLAEETRLRARLEADGGPELSQDDGGCDLE